MANVAVIGAQWGDEGKGKIVDWLSERADVVVRFQGGHNAGHTLVIGNVEYKLSLLPSGVVRPDKLSIIGNGVVVDPWALLKEIDAIAAKGVRVTPDNLKLADNAVAHPALARPDRPGPRGGARRAPASARPAAASARPTRTRSGRRAIRVCDLADPATLGDKIDDLLVHHNALLRGLGAPEVERASLLAALIEIAPKVLPLRRDGLAAPRRGAPGRQAHPLRGRAGHDARRRPRDLSLRHLVEHGGGTGGVRRRHRAGRGRLCARHHQGLYDARRQRPLPDRAHRRDRRDAGPQGP